MQVIAFGFGPANAGDKESLRARGQLAVFPRGFRADGQTRRSPSTFFRWKHFCQFTNYRPSSNQLVYGAFSAE
jgi:hypothetical protein